MKKLSVSVFIIISTVQLLLMSGCQKAEQPSKGQFHCNIGGYEFYATEGKRGEGVNAIYIPSNGGTPEGLSIVGDDGTYNVGLTAYYYSQPVPPATFPLDITAAFPNQNWGIGLMQGSAINSNSTPAYQTWGGDYTGLLNIMDINIEHHTVSGNFFFTAKTLSGSSEILITAGDIMNIKISNWDDYISSGKNPTGNATCSFYLINGSHGSVSISINGTNKATLTQYYTSGAPATCGLNGTAAYSYTVSTGTTFTFQAQGANSGNWNYNITANESCKIYTLN